MGQVLFQMRHWRSNVGLSIVIGIAVLLATTEGRAQNASWRRLTPPNELQVGGDFRGKARGDFDLDGTDDIAIGQPAYTSAGRVVLRSGATGAILRAIFPVGPLVDGEGLGTSVLAIEDLDGDGLHDLVISSPSHSSTPRVEAYSSASGQRLWFVLSPDPALGFGWSLSRIDDLDGDGRDDVIIGAPLRSLVSTFNFVAPQPSPDGVILVVSGANGSILHTLQSGGNPLLRSTFGASVISPGDLDGDAVKDVFICNGQWRNGPARAALSGTTGNLIWINFPLFPSAYFSLSLGNPALVDLDRDGDGRDDLLVESPGFLFGSRLYSISSGTGNILSVQESQDGHEAFGVSVIPTSDMDGDGSGDVLVGAPRYGSSQLRTCGAAYLMSSSTGWLLRRFEGTASFQAAGFSLAELGDINADGVSDFAVGSPMARTWSLIEDGRVDAYSGATGSVLWTRRGPLNGALFGGGMLRVADRNGDGIADLAVTRMAVSGAFSSSVQLISGLDGSSIWTWTTSIFQTFIGWDLVDAGDLDGDGVSDLLVNGANRPMTSIFDPTSIGTMLALARPVLPASASEMPASFGFHAISGATGTGIWTTLGMTGGLRIRLL